MLVQYCQAIFLNYHYFKGFSLKKPATQGSDAFLVSRAATTDRLRVRWQR